MKVNRLTTKVTVHRRLLFQFRGFSGSEGPSHSTNVGEVSFLYPGGPNIDKVVVEADDSWSEASSSRIRLFPFSIS